MPELPEVQMFANSIQANYCGSKIEKIIFHRDNLRFILDKKKLTQIFFKNSLLQKCFRVGKQLVLQTDTGCALVSLGMTGSFHQATDILPEKHQHITIFFQGKKPLAYIDPRRFGSWTTYNPDKFCTIADPLNSEDLQSFFNSNKFFETQRSVKDILMDQKHIGGLGNIYVLEALFRAKIHPLCPCNQITKKEKKSLSIIIPAILNKAIELKGSSIKSYQTMEKELGSFQRHHLVYNRHNQACSGYKCKGTILRIPQNGRSSWYCSQCQRER